MKVISGNAKSKTDLEQLFKKKLKVNLYLETHVYGEKQSIF